MAEPFDLSRPNRTMHAGVILTNGTTELLDIAPFHLLGSLSKVSLADMESLGPFAGLTKQGMDIAYHWVNESGEPAQITAGMRILPTDTFATCPPLDVVLMGANEIGYVPSEAEIAFVRKSFEHCQAFISVCGGFQVPLLAGLHNGKTATAPVFLLGGLRQDWPNTEWVAKRWCQDGKLWTTGTLINGLDAMRAFALQTWGGRGGMVEKILTGGAWPVRENDLQEHVA